MKFTLLGYGKMGKAIEEVAISRGHSITRDISKSDLAIDFSHSSAVLGHVKLAAQHKKNIVIGTTGWQDNFTEVKELVESSETGLLFSSNFSLGVNLFYKIIQSTAQLMNKFDQYDVAGFESHHNQKADAPSGTATELINILLKEIERKESAVNDLSNRAIAAEELHFPSLRQGAEPGTHRVIFDSGPDTITLEHKARNRTGFAHGAVLAAEFLAGKVGIFDMNDLLKTHI